MLLVVNVTTDLPRVVTNKKDTNIKYEQFALYEWPSLAPTEQQLLQFCLMEKQVLKHIPDSKLEQGNSTPPVFLQRILPTL